jgi:hypothetical protein
MDLAKPSNLKIVGAAYGSKDVTDIVAQYVKENSLEIRASNEVFGDPWYGVRKTLVVFYKFGNSRTYHSVSMEGEMLKIHYVDLYHDVFSTDKAREGLHILGAVYGEKEVTCIVNSKIKNNKLEMEASNAHLGDGLFGIQKTLVLVYQYGTQEYERGVLIARENAPVSIDNNVSSGNKQLTIIGAAYGTQNVTTKVAGAVKNNQLVIRAANDVFGDPWYGVLKTLVVFYKFGESKTYSEVSLENETMKIAYNDDFHNMNSKDKGPMQGLSILGAVYGMKDVTPVLNEQINNGKLNMAVENSIMGDGLPNIVKSLVVLYSKDETTGVAILKEHATLNL